jgi:ubiquinone/menaquinone biosynthesis C-methylase UbiE
MNVAELYDRLWDFGKTRVLTVACRTGILTRLAKSAATEEEVAGELGLNGLATGKIVRALCSLGVVEAAGNRYQVVEELRPHLLPGDLDLTPFIDHAHSLYDRWGATLEEWARTGIHPSRKRSAEGLLKFGQGMVASASLMAPQVIKALDGLSGVKKVLDVGGGIGGYARFFIRAGEVSVTVLDIPEVAELGRKSFLDEDRINFIGGDYHETDFGSGYDLVLMANILHIESQQDAALLVGKAAKACSPGGRVAVVDFAIDDQKRENVMGCLFAINMRGFGDTHSQPQIRGWMQQAGISDMETFDFPPAHWMITGTTS